MRNRHVESTEIRLRGLLHQRRFGRSWSRMCLDDHSHRHPTSAFISGSSRAGYREAQENKNKNNTIKKVIIPFKIKSIKIILFFVFYLHVCLISLQF